MGLDRAQSDLELYYDSIDKWGYPDEWRDSGDPMVLKKTRPPLRESLLEELVSIAEYNDLNESFWGHVDPQGTLEEVVEDLDNKFGLSYPPDLREKYGTTIEEREARFEDWKQERREEMEEPPEKEEEAEQPPTEQPPEDIPKRLIGEKPASADEAEESDATDDDGVVTSFEPDNYDPPATDEYGYGSIRLPGELLCLLERAKVEYEEFNSNRAVIEAMARNTGEFTDNIEDDDGNLWPEWHATLEQSIDVPHPENGD